MSTETIYNNLNTAYLNINESIKNAKRAATEYEVYMSDLEHSEKQGIQVFDVDNYFNNLLKIDEKSNNN